MTSVASPFGLKPASHPSGCIRQDHGTIASGYPTTIYQNAPVAIAADGTLITRVGTVLAAGAIVGAFAGCEYTDSSGRRHVDNKWVANTVATDIVAYYTSDPDIIYEVQADDTLAQANVGDQYACSALAGNNITGLSSVALDVSVTATLQSLRVVGLNPSVDNAFGDAYPIVRVQISNHQFRAASAAVA